jgi:hypothetical protein
MKLIYLLFLLFRSDLYFAVTRINAREVKYGDVGPARARAPMLGFVLRSDQKSTSVRPGNAFNSSFKPKLRTSNIESTSVRPTNASTAQFEDNRSHVNSILPSRRFDRLQKKFKAETSLATVRSVAGDLCRHPEGCSKHASFGQCYGAARLFCALHRPPGFVDVKHRACNSAQMSPTMSKPCSKLTLKSCIDHRNAGGIAHHLFQSRHKSACLYANAQLFAKIRRRCVSNGCSAPAVFGTRGMSPSVCKLHRESQHIDLRHKRCHFVGPSGRRDCVRQPSFGNIRDGVARFCRAHRHTDHVDVRSIRCAAFASVGCRRSASFGPPGALRPSFCAAHSTEGHVNIRATRRRPPGSVNNTHFGSSSLYPLQCASRRKLHAVGNTYLRPRSLSVQEEGWEVLWKDPDATVHLLRDPTFRTASHSQASDSMADRGGDGHDPVSAQLFSHSAVASGSAPGSMNRTNVQMACIGESMSILCTAKSGPDPKNISSSKERTGREMLLSSSKGCVTTSDRRKCRVMRMAGGCGISCRPSEMGVDSDIGPNTVHPTTSRRGLAQTESDISQVDSAGSAQGSQTPEGARSSQTPPSNSGPQGAPCIAAESTDRCFSRDGRERMTCRVVGATPRGEAGGPVRRGSSAMCRFQVRCSHR